MSSDDSARYQEKLREISREYPDGWSVCIDCQNRFDRLDPDCPAEFFRCRGCQAILRKNLAQEKSEAKKGSLTFGALTSEQTEQSHEARNCSNPNAQGHPE